MSSRRCRPPVRWALRAAAGFCVLCGPSLVAVSGCLDRPVSPLEPNTTNVVIEKLSGDRIERIDLLFMIDNSISMADKQKLLANAVPPLVSRLVQPRCIGADGAPSGGQFPCAPPSVAEFEPVVDIHVGVVSSSLGPHGGQFCGNTPPGNDRGQLLPAVRPELALPNDGNGFLWWHPGGDFGSFEVESFAERFKTHVQAAGEAGCGFEASLESWYRFLIDPSPPAEVAKIDGFTQRIGVDEALLAQRREFLRPDSLVAIVMLSDENDCSIRDSDVGWYATQEAHLAPGTSSCASDPNSPCCRSCAAAEQSPPAGCEPLCADPACKPGCENPASALLTASQDGHNLRCWQQKRRFGIDFLYPTRRYVNALSKLWLCPSRPDLDPELCPEAERVPNPLYRADDGSPLPRTPDLVFLAGIVGVPWQDIATPQTLGAAGELDYMTAAELEQSGRWSWISPTGEAPPLDPLMRESPEPRSGKHPSGDPSLDPAPPEAAPGTNVANGHEWRPMDVGAGNPTSIGDLQYACTFRLPESVPCSTQSCDCNKVGEPGYSENKPLCQASDGSYGSTQVAAKAYPGLRQLEVLRDYGKNSIVASICPKLLDPGSPDYGYNPAVDAIVDRLADYLQGRCLPRTLAIKDGVVPCEVVEASPIGASCSCDAAGRAPVTAALAAAVRRQLASLQACGADSPLGPCDALCLCGVSSYTGEALTACQTDPGFDAGDGWCYVDPAQSYPATNPGTDQLLVNCAPQEKRLLRFEPQSGATALIACQGAAVTSLDGG